MDCLPAARHTTPGGYIEQVEIDWVPQCEGADVPENSALLEWSQKFLGGMDKFQRSARVSSPKVLVEAAGFVDFKETIIRCCVNPWCDDPHDRLVADWHKGNEPGAVGGRMRDVGLPD